MRRGSRNSLLSNLLHTPLVLKVLTRAWIRSGWPSSMSDATSVLWQRLCTVRVALPAMTSSSLSSPACSSATMPAESNIAFMRSSSMPDTFMMTHQAFSFISTVLPIEAMFLTDEKQGDSKTASAHVSTVLLISPSSVFVSSTSRSRAVRIISLDSLFATGLRLHLPSIALFLFPKLVQGFGGKTRGIQQQVRPETTGVPKFCCEATF